MSRIFLVGFLPVRSSVVVFVEAVLIVLCVTPFLFFFFFVELLGGGITIVDHSLLCFLPLTYDIAVLVAAMLLLSFLFERRFLSPLFYLFFFLLKFLLPTWVLQPRPFCNLLTLLLLPACHNVNRFVASSLFWHRVIFPYSYRIRLLC